MLSCANARCNTNVVLELDKNIVISLVKRTAYRATGKLYECSSLHKCALFKHVGILKTKHTRII